MLRELSWSGRPWWRRSSSRSSSWPLWALVHLEGSSVSEVELDFLHPTDSSFSFHNSSLHFCSRLSPVALRLSPCLILLVPEGAGIIALERPGNKGFFELSDLVDIEKRLAGARHDSPSARLGAPVPFFQGCRPSLFEFMH